VHGWKELARMAGQERVKMMAQGKPAFILCEHYGFTSQISFYLPEAKRRVATDPIVFYLATPTAENQYYYWPNYLNRVGQNALFVREIEKPRFRPDWFSRWWSRKGDLYENALPPTRPLPPEVRQEFESITDLGIRDVVVDGNIVRRVQFFECRDLR
jgi:hypothetical protein